MVDYDNPVVYTGYTLGKVKKEGKVWYTMGMVNDIADFLSDTESGWVQGYSSAYAIQGEAHHRQDRCV